MHKWIDMFKNGRTLVIDKEEIQKGTLQVCMLILGRRRVIIDDMTDQLQISYASTHHGHNFCEVTFSL
jgi:hypothetical protein